MDLVFLLDNGFSMTKATQGTNTSHDKKAIDTILNSLDALVYVSDLKTYEVLYLNDYGIAQWGSARNKKCFQLLQSGQTSPCSFCTNHRLLDAEGNPNGVYVWEFQNTLNGRWYQCRDQAIRWTDGRLVRIEIAFDITDRKSMEQELLIAKSLAEKQADTDMLTQINNRRAFFNQGVQIVHQSHRLKESLAVIMFDLDHFKQINDLWGHATGDAALIHVAHLAQDIVRKTDLLARIGGEEFAILLPNATQEQAAQLAERIRQAFANTPMAYDGREIYCTASFGVSSLALEHIAPDYEPNQLLGALVNFADEAMINAKRQGRNRICRSLELSFG